MAEQQRITRIGNVTKHQNKGSVIVATGTTFLDSNGAAIIDCLREHDISKISGASVSLLGGIPAGQEKLIPWVTWTGQNVNTLPFETPTETNSVNQALNAATAVSYTVWGTS